VLDLLRHSVDEQATKKAALQHKLDIQLRRHELASSREEFQKVLDAVRHFLLYVEQELTAQAPRVEWLTGDELSVADISLGLLLHRLYQLGFENQFWTFGKLPQVEAYFSSWSWRSDGMPPLGTTMPAAFWPSSWWRSGSRNHAHTQQRARFSPLATRTRTWAPISPLAKPWAPRPRRWVK